MTIAKLKREVTAGFRCRSDRFHQNGRITMTIGRMYELCSLDYEPE